jgi:hypothetical protein
LLAIIADEKDARLLIDTITNPEITKKRSTPAVPMMGLPDPAGAHDRVGFLSGASLETMREYVAAFQQGLAHDSQGVRA